MMTQASSKREAPVAEEDPTDFDDQDELLAALYDLCTPEQKLRANTPRETLAKLAPSERASLLKKLAPGLRDQLRQLIGK